jgi:hypothetical protein
MFTYISVSMNGIARITPNTKSHLCGLGTHGLKTCVGAFIFHDKAMSIIHIDMMTDLKSLLDEVKIIGEACQILLVKNESGSARANARYWLQQRGVDKVVDLCATIIDFLQKHLPEITPKVFDSPTGDAYLDRSGKLTLNPDNLTADIIYTPQTRLRYAVQYLNAIFLNKLRPACLEFDGENFLDMPMLCDQARIIASAIRPYLRARKLDESSINIDAYLEKEVIDKLQSHAIKMHMAYMKDPLVSCFATILDNSISTKYFNSRPIFFKGVDNIKILYSPSATRYAASLVNIISNIDSDEEKSSMDHSKISKAFNEEFKIPVNETTNSLLILPIFWLKQLADAQITELATEFNIDRAGFKSSFTPTIFRT